MKVKEKRRSERKSIEKVKIEDLTALSDYGVIAHHGHIIDASALGFKVEIHRDDLLPEELRSQLNLDILKTEHVALYLPQMDLDLDGRVTRSEHVGNGIFHIAVDFSHTAPEYWRMCLVDLLPEHGEIINDDDSVY